MREVEVKYTIDPVGAVRISDAVGAVGAEWALIVHQDDQAYAEVDWECGQSKIGRRFARLRTENGQHHVVTTKIPQSGELDCHEIERVVADRAAEGARLRTQGFRPTIRIVKTRRTAAWRSMQLCLDDVEGLGWFLEAEMLVDDDRNGIELQTHMERELARLGVELTAVAETYDSLLHHARHPDTHTSAATRDTAGREVSHAAERVRRG